MQTDQRYEQGSAGALQSQCGRDNARSRHLKSPWACSHDTTGSCDCSCPGTVSHLHVIPCPLSPLGCRSCQQAPLEGGCQGLGSATLAGAAALRGARQAAVCTPPASRRGQGFLQSRQKEQHRLTCCWPIERAQPRIHTQTRMQAQGHEQCRSTDSEAEHTQDDVPGMGGSHHWEPQQAVAASLTEPHDGTCNWRSCCVKLAARRPALVAEPGPLSRRVGGGGTANCPEAASGSARVLAMGGRGAGDAISAARRELGMAKGEMGGGPPPGEPKDCTAEQGLCNKGWHHWNPHGMLQRMQHHHHLVKLHGRSSPACKHSKDIVHIRRPSAGDVLGPAEPHL